MQLDISQAASLLGTSEAMLVRWAKQGAIPAVEVNNHFYFKRENLEAWAARRHITLRETAPSAQSIDCPGDSIVDAVMLGGCHHDVPGNDAVSLLTNLVARIDIGGVDQDILLARMLERESLSSTGIGNGIAIPHPRQPLENLERSAIVTCFPAAPVPFNALDGQPVDVLFLILSVDTQRHLKLLSQLSYILHQPGNAALFHRRPAEETIFELVRAQSKNFIK